MNIKFKTGSYYILCILFMGFCLIRTYLFISSSFTATSLSIFPYFLFLIYPLLGRKYINLEMLAGLTFYFIIDFGLRLFLFAYYATHLRTYGVLFLILNISIPLFFFPIFLAGRKMFVVIFLKKNKTENNIIFDKHDGILLYFSLWISFSVLAFFPTGLLMTKCNPMVILSLFPYVFFPVYPIFWKMKFDLGMSVGILFYFLIDLGLRFFIFQDFSSTAILSPVLIDLLGLLSLICFPVYLLGIKLFNTIFQNNKIVLS